MKKLKLVVKWFLLVVFGSLSLYGIYGILSNIFDKYSSGIWILGLPGFAISVLVTIYALKLKVE